MSENTKRKYNINGTVQNVRVGATKGGTKAVNFTLVSTKADGSTKKYLVDAYGKAADKVTEGGFAVDGVQARVWGVFETQVRTDKDSGKERRVTVVKLVSIETPKTKEKIAALRAAKKAREQEAAAA